MTAFQSPCTLLPRPQCPGAWSTRFATWAALLFVVFVSTGYSQTPTMSGNREIPDFRVQVWPRNVEDFNTRVWAYFDLRGSLEKGLIALTLTDDPAKIEKAESDLAGRLRVARPEARQGDFFTPAIEREFKKALIFEMSAGTWAAIMDGNPGAFPHAVNGTYKRSKSVSTVPPNILALLPTLPDDIQYRFVGRHLILHDTRANVIIDRIPYAIRCGDCEDSVE
jgi:hypothetical protein